jgi:hypothetical protein
MRETYARVRAMLEYLRCRARAWLSPQWPCSARRHPNRWRTRWADNCERTRLRQDCRDERLGIDRAVNEYVVHMTLLVRWEIARRGLSWPDEADIMPHKVAYGNFRPATFLMIWHLK